MALIVCSECSTKCAFGLTSCPHCASTLNYMDGEDMPKISKHVGATVEGAIDPPPETIEAEDTPPVDEVPTLEGEPGPEKLSEASVDTTTTVAPESTIPPDFDSTGTTAHRRWS